MCRGNFVQPRTNPVTATALSTVRPSPAKGAFKHVRCFDLSQYTCFFGKAVDFTPHGGLVYHAQVDAFLVNGRRAIRAIALDPAMAFSARGSPPGRRIDEAADYFSTRETML